MTETPLSAKTVEMSEISIQVRKLSKVFGAHPQKSLKLRDRGLKRKEIQEKTGDTLGLSNITFDVYKGEMLVIMGLSGSGKSTLVRCLNRLIEASEGEILIDGQDVTKLDKSVLREFRRKHFSMVFQNFALLPHRTITENAAFGLEIRGMAKKERRENALKALEQVGLTGWEDHYPAELSGGMQQRVGLARALANDSDILLMDEAFSALDPLIRADMQQELIDLQAHMHKTVIFITHDLDEAINIGDRIVLLKDGEIIQIGTPEEILTHPADDYVERFVANIDRSKVLSAENIMRRTRNFIFEDDGPRTALYKMSELDTENAFVLRRGDRTLIGLINADDVNSALKQNQPLSSAIRKDIQLIDPQTNMQELYAMLAEHSRPLPVVENGKLRGVITRTLILEKLAEQASLQGENL